MARDRVSMKSSSRRVTPLLLRLLVVPALVLFLCFAFTLPLPHFALRRNDIPSRDPVIPLVGDAGVNPVQALVDALRSATADASRYRNVSFNGHDAQV